MLFLLLLVCVFVLFLNYHVLKANYRLLNPVNVYAIAWALVMIMYRIIFDEYVAFRVYLCIILSVIFLAVGFWLMCNKRIYFKTNGHFEYSQMNINYLRTLLIIFTVLNVSRCILVFYTVYNAAGRNLQFALSGSTALRLQYLERNTSAIMAILTVFLTVNAFVGYIVLGINLAKKGKNRVFFFAIWTVMEFFASYVGMSKMNFFIYIIVLSFSYLNYIESIKLQFKQVRRLLPPTIILLISLMVVIGLQRNYSTNGESMLVHVVKGAMFYFCGSVSALNSYINSTASDYSIISNTASIFYKIFVRLGIVENSSITNHLQTVVTSLGTTNSYSWFLPFYKDLSLFGMIFYPFLFGLLAGVVYNKKTNTLAETTINASFCVLFAMSFYQFTWSQGSYFYVIFYVLIIQYFIRKCLYNNRDTEQNGGITS